MKLIEKFQPYNPRSATLSLRDFMAWFAFYDAAFLALSDSEANYALTALIPAALIQGVFNALGTRVKSYDPRYTARHYGIAIYKAQGNCPVRYATTLRIGRDNITTLKELIERVVELHFCRIDAVITQNFLLDVWAGVALHIDKAATTLLHERMQQRYPEVVECAADTLGKGNRGEYQRMVVPGGALPMPSNADEVEEYCNFLKEAALVISSQSFLEHQWEMQGVRSDSRQANAPKREFPREPRGDLPKEGERRDGRRPPSDRPRRTNIHQLDAVPSKQQSSKQQQDEPKKALGTKKGTLNPAIDKEKCRHCGKQGHEEIDCWSKHPDKRPPRREWTKGEGKRILWARPTEKRTTRRDDTSGEERKADGPDKKKNGRDRNGRSRGGHF